MEKISVIVPVYNAEDYLEKCLDSILQQTYTNIELILVNDGATDGSAAICERYRQADNRVRVFHKENGGVGSSRNRALEVVTGDYILFVDCDDWLVPDHLEQLYHLLKKEDVDVAIGNFTEFQEDTQLFMIHIGEDDYYEKVYTPFEWFHEQYNPRFSLSQCFTVPWAKLYKASLFEQIVYPTDKKVEDDYTTYKVYLKADKIAYLNKPIYLHRKRDTSVTRKVSLADVYPLQSIEERLMLLTLAGAPQDLLDKEKEAYKWRLGVHAEECLKFGQMEAYQQVVTKQAILTKAKKRQLPPRLKALTITDSQDLLAIDQLIEALPFVEFHIAAQTAMGDKLLALADYGNVRLHPGQSAKELSTLAKDMDLYLDINLGGTQEGILDDFHKQEKPILAFYLTQHGDHGQLLFSSQRPEELIEAITFFDAEGKWPEIPGLPQVKSIDESLNYIWANNASVMRFGDGEINLIKGLPIAYQDYDEQLAKDLREIVQLESSKRVLICLPDVFDHRFQMTTWAQDFWKKDLDDNDNLYRELAQAPWYGSTFISRPYIDMLDKSQARGQFEKLKKLWRNRDILIVEGSTSRSGVGNDLFDSAKSIKRIICPSRNAYQSLEAIEKAIRDHIKGRLVILMLGPTAKVLAYHLSQAGYQALDLGHIDSEYEWLRMGAETKVKLPHKHTAEFNFDQDIELEDDPRYQSQIVIDLSETDTDFDKDN